MKIPTIHGYIERRILVNYTIDPNIAAKIIPTPFRPKIYNGKAMAGICLIRLKGIKPKGFPDFMGISSENAAHRFAVEWDENGVIKEGVYIPRRDTSSILNAMAGGKVFPGKHYRANFQVQEANGEYNISFISSDTTTITLEAKETESIPVNSVFKDLNDASCFFQKGSLGYSPDKNKFDGITLNAYKWEVSPLEVLNAESSFFSDESLFPKGSVIFDNALLMKNIEHEWISADRKYIK
jgi:hypothetical protein